MKTESKRQIERRVMAMGTELLQVTYTEARRVRDLRTIDLILASAARRGVVLA